MAHGTAEKRKKKKLIHAMKLANGKKRILNINVDGLV
jgi:hypothetical protein